MQADAVEKSTLEAKFSLEGQELPVRIQRVRTQQPFAMTYAPDQILPGKDDEATGEPEDWQPDPQVNPSLAFADGYWVLVRPQRAGEYVLETFGEVPEFDFSVRVRYILRVVGPEDQVAPAQ